MEARINEFRTFLNVVRHDFCLRVEEVQTSLNLDSLSTVWHTYSDGMTQIAAMLVAGGCLLINWQQYMDSSLGENLHLLENVAEDVGNGKKSNHADRLRCNAAENIYLAFVFGQRFNGNNIYDATLIGNMLSSRDLRYGDVDYDRREADSNDDDDSEDEDRSTDDEYQRSSDDEYGANDDEQDDEDNDDDQVNDDADDDYQNRLHNNRPTSSRSKEEKSSSLNFSYKNMGYTSMPSFLEIIDQELRNLEIVNKDGKVHVFLLGELKRENLIKLAHRNKIKAPHVDGIVLAKDIIQGLRSSNTLIGTLIAATINIHNESKALEEVSRDMIEAKFEIFPM